MKPTAVFIQSAVHMAQSTISAQPVLLDLVYRLYIENIDIKC